VNLLKAGESITASRIEFKGKKAETIQAEKDIK